MKRSMELNGVANIKLMLDIYTTKMVDGQIITFEMDTETFEAIQNQLELLERYMLAYNNAVREDLPTPHWHEVRDNPTMYALHREIVN